MRGFISRMLDFNGRELKKLQKTVDQVNTFAAEVAALDDQALQAKTPYFKALLSQGNSLEDILPEAFAVVREVAWRQLGMRPYDVQVLGGIALHQGRITEMRTGEGKTLAATMPAYLNALAGKGVHVVTVNDYLAERDSEWMGAIYRFLGLDVGLIISGMQPAERLISYNADITYGTNNEFGFDYLRDNMALSTGNIVQRPLNYAIIDEVDSILIDEARTPLIISGPQEAPVSEYRRFSELARSLKKDQDYEVDEKARSVTLTDIGVTLAESKLKIENLYDQENMELNHKLSNALHAKELKLRNRDYIVSNNEVIIVDTFTGRLMNGRRYSDGLHQAIEAKENVKVAKEDRTLATITFQNYFRMYKKLAGMTGTAKTEEEEFSNIYGMDVLVIPTNKPMIRDDMPDQVYRRADAKLRAVVEDIIRCHEIGQPVLVGTVSIDKSEMLSGMLKKKRIKHNVLNAKHHEQEAEIVMNAGQFGMVTIATNMAGRGTDIKLGEGVIEVGGLRVIGTERHDSRRIDNQLRGRSGRQGDPGSSQFYLSFEDDLMRLFATDMVENLIERGGFDDDFAIEHKLVDRMIERAQERVEGRNYAMRKRVLEYDDVMNKQREVIYQERRRVLDNQDLAEQVSSMLADIAQEIVNAYTQGLNTATESDFEGMVRALRVYYPDFPDNTEKWQDMLQRDVVLDIQDHLQQIYQQREQEFTTPVLHDIERYIMLRVVDRKWMDHIDAVTRLRQGISLRAYGGKDPILEYQSECYVMFQNLISEIKQDTVRDLFHVQLKKQERDTERKQVVNRPAPGPQKPKRSNKIGRNDPCPCGSGLKYKKCCGR